MVCPEEAEEGFRVRRPLVTIAGPGGPMIHEVEKERFSTSDQLNQSLCISGSGDDPAIGQDERRHALNPQSLSELDTFVHGLRVTRWLGQWLLLKGVIKKGQGFLANNGLGFIIGLGMNFRKRVHLDAKCDIFSFFDDLLHLLMKFGAARSVGVVE
jgi:hypothetical protein